MSTPVQWTERRASTQVSVSLPTPLILAGRPVVPRWWAVLPSTSHAVQGSAHVRAQNPTPPPTARNVGSGPGTAQSVDWSGRWVVDDLPDPPNGGYYWLGDPSWADGTGNYSGGRTRWAPHGSTPAAPAWRSFFPYKPSVRAHDTYLPDGGTVHHPKGVHLNSQYVEHMWCDFGGPRRQPFTWVITAMIAGFPSLNYRHYLLDAGRDPDAVHFPRLSSDQADDGRLIADGLPYRSLMTYSRHNQQLCTRPNTAGPRTVRCGVHANIRPKMFFGVFNGAKSMTGAFGPDSRRYGHGAVDNGTVQKHRFYVLGRAQGHIDPAWASHLLIFEIRYWRAALSLTQIFEQFDQLSSTYQFHRYLAIGGN